MASFMYNAGLKKMWDRLVAGSALNLFGRLVMTNTTVDTENDAKAFLSDFTTMDTHDGSGYVDKALTPTSMAVDDTNNRAILDIADVTWTALGAGTRPIEGLLVYDQVSAVDSARVPLGFLDPSNISSNGGDITVVFNASGVFAISGTGSP